MQKHLLILALSSVFLINSCSLTPPLIKPNLPEKWTSAVGTDAVIQNLPYLAWWQQLNDPVLNSLIETGLKNNNDIQIATANLAQAQGQLKQVQLSWLPFANGLAGFSQNPVLGAPGGFYGVFAQYAVNLMQLPFLQKQAKYNVEIQKAQINAVRLTLIGQISSSYLTFIAQKEQLNLLKTLEKNIQSLIDIQQAALEGKITTAIDLDLLKSQQQEVIAAEKVVENNLVLSQNALHFLLNENPGPLERWGDFTKITDKLSWPGNLPTSVLANRPDLQVAEAQVNMAREGVKVSASNLFPAIQLDRFMGNKSRNKTIISPTDSFSMDEAYVNWQIKPSVLGDIEAGQGSYKATTYNYIKTVRQILRDVDNDFAAAHYLNDKLKAYQNAFQDLSKEYDLQKALYDNDLIPYSQVLGSKLRLDNMNLMINQSKLEQLMVQVLLYQDLAGGYESQTNPVEKSK
jgi:multidrug efflux system outer membrane protein